MKFRLVDILLMVGLFLVGAAILWTLFTLGNDRTRPVTPSDEPPAAASPAESEGGGGVVPVAPGGGASDGAGAGPAADQDDAAGADGLGAPAAPAVPDATDPEPDVVAAEPIVEGEPVTLERVGFSFTTGGAGACGVVLEPWEHVAVSRDLLAVYGCGAEVTIDLTDEVAGRTEVSLVVADTMNEQFTRTANIYVAPDEPAIEYGVTDGTLIP